MPETTRPACQTADEHGDPESAAQPATGTVGPPERQSAAEAVVERTRMLGGSVAEAVHAMQAALTQAAGSIDPQPADIPALVAMPDLTDRERADFLAAAAELDGEPAPQELERLRARVAQLEQTLDATRQQLLAEANRLMRRPSHPPAAPDTAWWLRRLAECPVCSGPKRETTGMVCQACGKDWGPPAGGKPGFWLDDDGQWQPLSATPPETAGGGQDG